MHNAMAQPNCYFVDLHIWHCANWFVPFVTQCRFYCSHFVDTSIKWIKKVNILFHLYQICYRNCQISLTIFDNHDICGSFYICEKSFFFFSKNPQTVIKIIINVDKIGFTSNQISITFCRAAFKAIWKLAESKMCFGKLKKTKLSHRMNGPWMLKELASVFKNSQQCNM